jgi:acyl-CoA synthetase (AMP-forming)/AMP-acid ligase II
MTLDTLQVNATIADVLRENARVRPDAEAVTDGARRFSWKQLHEAALDTCSRFSSLGIRGGDRVAVVLANHLEAVVLYWACALSGAVFVGISPRLGHDDMRNVLEHSGATVAFVADDAAFEQIHAMHLPQLREVIGIDGGAGTGSFRRSVDASPQTGVAPSDAFAICYTSGTTGRPKGAVLTHGNLLWNATSTARALECTERDTLLLTVGITHIFGLSAGVLCAAVCGARLVLLTTFAAASALDLCEWEGVTVLHGTPTMFVLELAAQRRAPRDLHKLRTGIIAAAPVAPELVDQIRSELHCDVQIAWGLTETAPTVTITANGDPPDARRSSVGKPLPDAQIRIDRDGQEYGEILVKSPGVFRGYYDDAEITAAAMTEDGWFRTGDLGYVDALGYVHIKGRKKEIIIRGGFHVYPDEIEQLLSRLPWVRAVAVIGIPDPVLGERTCACIVEGDNVPEDMLAAVRSAVSSRLADYKLPDAVLRVAELPRTPAGKILKTALREDAVSRIAAR